MKAELERGKKNANNVGGKRSERVDGRGRKEEKRKIESGMREELKYEGEKEGGENRIEKERKR